PDRAARELHHAQLTVRLRSGEARSRVGAGARRFPRPRSAHLRDDLREAAARRGAVAEAAELLRAAGEGDVELEPRTYGRVRARPDRAALMGRKRPRERATAGRERTGRAAVAPE